MSSQLVIIQINIDLINMIDIKKNISHVVLNYLLNPNSIVTKYF